MQDYSSPKKASQQSHPLPDKNPSKPEEKKNSKKILLILLWLLSALFCLVLGAGLYWFFTRNMWKRCSDDTPATQGETCTYNGKTYNDGDSFDSTDGCNTCRCSNGEVACTLRVCTSDGEESTEQEGADPYEGWKIFDSSTVEVYTGQYGQPSTTTEDWRNFEFTTEFINYQFKYPPSWVVDEYGDIYADSFKTQKLNSRGGLPVELESGQSCSDIEEVSSDWDGISVDGTYEVLSIEEFEIDNIAAIEVTEKHTSQYGTLYVLFYCFDVNAQLAFYIDFYEEESSFPNRDNFKKILPTVEIEF